MKHIRHVVHLSDTPLSSLDIHRLFHEAIYNARRNAYRVGNTLFIMPSFRLTDDERR